MTELPVTLFTLRSHSPVYATALVPRDIPFSNTSATVPGSAVPSSVKLEPTLAPSAGAVITGGAGAVVSIRSTSMLDAGPWPVASEARAVTRWSPSSKPVTMRDQLPLPFVVVVPRELPPSKISTVDPAAALPETVTLVVRCQL